MIIPVCFFLTSSQKTALEEQGIERLQFLALLSSEAMPSSISYAAADSLAGFENLYYQNRLVVESQVQKVLQYQPSFRIERISLLVFEGEFIRLFYSTEKSFSLLSKVTPYPEMVKIRDNPQVEVKLDYLENNRSLYSDFCAGI